MALPKYTLAQELEFIDYLETGSAEGKRPKSTRERLRTLHQYRETMRYTHGRDFTPDKVEAAIDAAIERLEARPKRLEDR